MSFIETELRFVCDAGSLTMAIEQLRDDASKFDVLEGVERILSLPDAASKLVRIESNICPTDACKVTIACNPSDCLLELVTTLRAGERNLFFGKVDHLLAS